jgi:ribonuclease P protein component
MGAMFLAGRNGLTIATDGGKVMTGRLPQPNRNIRAALTLGRAKRLRSKIDIQRSFDIGVHRHHRPLSARIFRRSDDAATRIVVSIGKRCGNAVMRNRIRRRIREAYRVSQQQFPQGLDILIMVQPHRPLTMVNYQTVLHDLLGGL